MPKTLKDFPFETQIRNQPLIDEAIKFFNDYFGFKEHAFTSQEIELLGHSSFSIKLENILWRSMNPKTKEEEEYYYRIDPFGFWRNFLKNMDRYHYELLREFVQQFVDNNVRTILDFGGGSGYLSILLNQFKFEVTFSEISHLALEWMRYITQKKKLPIKIIDLFKEEIKEQYDAIIIKDVLEHCKYPGKILTKLDKHAKIGIWAYPLTCPGKEDWIPMHYKFDANDYGCIITK